MKKCSRPDFIKLIRRMLTGYLVYNNTDSSFVDEIAARNGKIFLDEISSFEKWLEWHGIYDIELSKIHCILIRDVIITDETVYTGYALKFANEHLIFVHASEDWDTLISLIFHEIIHVEIEGIIDEATKGYSSEEIEKIKEEIVTIIENSAIAQLTDCSNSSIKTRTPKTDICDFKSFIIAYINEKVKRDEVEQICIKK